MGDKITTIVACVAACILFITDILLCFYAAGNDSVEDYILYGAWSVIGCTVILFIQIFTHKSCNTKQKDSIDTN